MPHKMDEKSKQAAAARLVAELSMLFSSDLKSLKQPKEKSKDELTLAKNELTLSNANKLFAELVKKKKDREGE